jgi:hypothetical protein
MSRRLIFLIVLLVAAAAPLLGPAPAAAEPGCRFVLGFKTLHDLIPDIVGDCLVDEHVNPRNGDSLQETTRGLMVWRKADNWTAFTDGYRTWINGPYGLQTRLNTERFPWEPPLSACTIPSDALTFDAATIGPDGAATGRLTVENPCELPANLMIDVFTQSPTDSSMIADAPTIFIQDLPPHASETFSYRVLMAIPGSAPQTGFSWFTGSPGDWLCVDVGATRCLKIDPWLKSTVAALRTLDEGQALLEIAADAGTRIQRDDTPAGLIASYTPATRTITLDPRLDAYSSWVRATVLSHELQHAADDAAGNLSFTPANCYQAEETAFRRQAQVWSDFWHGRLPPNLDAMHQMLNDVTLTVARDPSGFVRSLVSAYQSECNPSTTGS